MNRIYILCISILVISIGACEVLSPPFKEEDKLTEQILFTSDRTENNTPGIYRMDPNGMNVVRLAEIADTSITEFYGYYEPSVSPNGDHIVFEGHALDSDNENIYTNIYKINVDGTSKMKLAGDGQNYYYLPSWHPEKSKIAFTKVDFEASEINIYTINEDGSSPERLTTFTTSDGFAYEPNWSPDGSEILFEYYHQGDSDNYNSDIYTLNADGTELRQVTESDSTDYSAVWSPNGDKLAFVSDRDGDPEIYTINTNGTKLKQITENKDIDYNPSFSPDGSEIVYHGYSASNTEKSFRLNNKIETPLLEKIGRTHKMKANNYEIYKIDVDGGSRTNVTENQSFDVDPEWAEVNIDDEEE